MILPSPACESPPEDVPDFAVVASGPADGERDVFTTVRRCGLPIEVVKDCDQPMNRYAILLID